MLAPAIMSLGACSWFSDFRDQPRIEPWEAEYAGNDTTPFRPGANDSTFVAYSVPITGNTVPGYVVSYNGSMTNGPGAIPNPAVVDSMAGIPNPHAANARVARQRTQVLSDQLRRVSRRGGDGQWCGGALRRARAQSAHAR